MGRYAPLRKLVLSDMAFVAAVAAVAAKGNASRQERSCRLQFGHTTLRRFNLVTTCGEAVAILARKQHIEAREKEEEREGEKHNGTDCPALTVNDVEWRRDAATLRNFQA